MTTTTLNQQGFAVANGTIRVYHKNEGTGEYIGSTEEFVLEGVGIPAHSYIDAPPKARKGYAICRINDDWIYVIDHRGKVAYSTETGQPKTISELGELPALMTFEAPATHFDRWDGAQWVTDEVAELEYITAVHELKKKELLADAREQMSILADAVEVDEATDEEIARLKLLKSYRLTLNRIDTSEREISWPEMP